MNMPEIDTIIRFRHSLHLLPEESGREVETSSRVTEFISARRPDALITGIGGTGLAAIFDGKAAGPVTCIRCELDAVSLPESEGAGKSDPLRSCSHACGHDGHMAIVAGISAALSSHPVSKGRVVLLFQPSEENGRGAAAVLSDTRFIDAGIDRIFGFHNIPGAPAGVAIVKDGVFASASVALGLQLEGKACHASEPEAGKSPSSAMARLILILQALPREMSNAIEGALVTAVYARLGKPAAGVAPQDASLMFTLRAHDDEGLEMLKNAAAEKARSIAASEGLTLNIDWTEGFPCTRNHHECVALIREAAMESPPGFIAPERPFRWSEDFGHYTRRFRGAFFGIGAGSGAAPLHTREYGFPDEIIAPSLRLFLRIIELIHG